MSPVSETEIIRETDRCVLCGLCLPHCPTYNKTRNESESPRGRIALIRAMAEARLPVSSTMEQHLDRCLTCRCCEAYCPANVAYGRIIDLGRSYLELHRRTAHIRTFFKWVLLNGLITKPKRLRRLGRAIRLYQISGLQAIARRSGLLRLFRLAKPDALLPTIKPFTFHKEIYPALGRKETGTVALFTGCLGPVCDSETLMAAIHLLNRLGYRVWVPENQTCCGALHQHGGRPSAAAALLTKNAAIFQSHPIEAVVSIISSCSAMLMEHADQPGPLSTGDSSPRYMDIHQFLRDISWPEEVVPAPLDRRVAIHEPCIHNNILRQSRHTYELLRRIPQLQIDSLPGNSQCCGAAGTYFLTQPEMAQSLLDDKVMDIQKANPDIIVTSNLGCAIQLSAGVRQAGLTIEVIHPVVLLARQLQSRTIDT